MKAYRLLALFAFDVVAGPPPRPTPAVLDGHSSRRTDAADALSGDSKPATISDHVASIRKREVCQVFYLTDDETLTESGLIVAKEEGGPAFPDEWKTATLEEVQAAELAESFSEKEFAELVAARELTSLAKSKWSLDLADVRTKLLGYQPLSPKSLRVKPLKLGSAAPAAVGSALWMADVVESFIKEATVLDRVAAVTSIVPIVGCAVNARARLEKDDFDGADVIDTALCLIGDGLLLSPLAPLGILTHVVRAIMSMFEAPEVPTQESVQRARDAAWVRFLDDNVYTYIYSDAYLYPDQGFRYKLQSSLAIEAMAIQSRGAQRIGAANASSHFALLDASRSAEEKAEIKNGTLEAIHRIRRRVSTEIMRRQRRALLQLPTRLREDMNLSLESLVEGYNKNFTDKITSREMVRHYTQVNFAEPGSPESPTNNAGDVSRQLNEIATHLKNTPPPMPSLLEVAYIAGQSKGLEGVDPRALSPQHFIRDHLMGLSKQKRDRLALHHALEVARFLQGNVTEDELSTLWPSNDVKMVRELQLLIAIKYGRVYDGWKVKYARERFQGPEAFFFDKQDPTAMRYLTHPDVLPVQSEPDSPEYLALVIEVDMRLIDSVLEDLALEGIDISNARLRVHRLRKKLQGQKFGEAIIRDAVARGRGQSQHSSGAAVLPANGTVRAAV
ncbi:Clostridium neurotoxin, translocation [Metarhizium album ARSEF 1941]|uniref:Clostridium neurotoxin, translocation n=1 Tax=Metarhizium album (strain ARSEF 1941) TaxID=1081103 RepID=A0A0B2WDR6_METAS|nr:Clostridium neurotoxin, translocation [Metarhizium album ARSEF 1941]KHN94021.1 Clostridium neurotoxin, translocation [Metarhizium album ARSEF 1941]